MRAIARRVSDRQQLVFDWNTAAVPVTAERENAAISLEGEEADGHERRNSTGRSPVLLGEAQPPGNPASSGTPPSPGDGDTDRAPARSDRAGIAGQGKPDHQPRDCGRPGERNGD